MNKFLKILLIFIVLILITTGLMILWPYMPKKYAIEEYGISFKLPNYYSTTEGENILFSAKSKKSNIEINVTAFKKDFFDRESAYELAESYKELIEKMNYNTVLQSVNINQMMKNGKQIGKANFEIKSLKQINEEVTLAIPLDENDVFVTISGTKDAMEKNGKEVDKIVDSIKFK